MDITHGIAELGHLIVNIDDGFDIRIEIESVESLTQMPRVEVKKHAVHLKDSRIISIDPNKYEYLYRACPLS